MSLEILPNQNQSDHSTSVIKIENKVKSSPDAKKAFWEAIKTVISLQNRSPLLVPISSSNNIPLSFSQERLWFLEQLQPSRSSAYNMPSTFRITGALNASVLKESLNEIVRRHEALRTTFSSLEGKPVQIIHPALNLPLSIIDLQHISPDQQQIKAKQLIREEVQRPFDLTQLPLLRATLLRLAKDEYLLLINVHHIVIDFWSKGILFQELSALYEAFSTGKPSPLPELSIQYADFAVWQREWLQGEFLEVLLNYWKPQIGSDLREQKLPIDYLRSPLQDRRSAYQKLVLMEELTKKLKALSRQEGTTLFTTLLAAFKVLLHFYTKQDDIFLCSPIANRNRKEIKEIIGYFVNLLILRTDLSGNPSFQELLERVHKVTLAGYSHQDLPVQQLVKSLNLLQVPLSRVMFSLQNTATKTLELRSLTVQALDVDSGAADFDLYLYLLEEVNTLTVTLKYNANLFDDATIVQMLKHFQSVLENIVANPEQSISLLLTLSGAEQQLLDKKLDSPSHAKQKGAYVAPRNTVEIQLTQLWSQILGIESISVKDNFFELGGESLLVMSLFAQIEKTFNKTLPLTTLLQAPTVEHLAKIVNQEGCLVYWSSLVPIQPNGTKPPLFCIHGQQGNVLNFRKLSQYLGLDQPFYGLQAQGLDGKELPYFRVEDIARHYIQEIRTLQPEEPYFLAGNSMGGTIAFEIAQQLHKQGQKVALLAMFDTFGLDCFPRLSFRRQHYLVYLLQLGISKSFFNEINELFQRRLQEIISRLYLSLGYHLPQNLRKELVAEANMQAKKAYKAQVYPGDVILFRASQPASFPKLYLPTLEDWYNRNPQHGWIEVVGGSLEIYDVPGDHFSIFEEPHVQVLAQKLKACIDEAQNNYQNNLLI